MDADGDFSGGPLLLDGTGLDRAGLAAAARGRWPVGVDAARAVASHAALAGVRDPVYGRTTGVGANRAVDADRDGHGWRLLRSHACDAGPALPADVTRAMLVIRLNQLAGGGSGVDPALLAVLAGAINAGVTPPVRRFGAIGTGDLTALATTALCLAGERPWDGGTAPEFVVDDADALAFISSNAATLGEAALAAHDLARSLDATVEVAARTSAAIGGSGEPFAAEVQDVRPHPGQVRVAAAMRRLRAAASAGPGSAAGPTAGPARVQDPYGLRAFPQVHGAAVDAGRHLDRVLRIELNAASENPLVADGRVFHNGNFHGAYLAAALDAAGATLAGTAALSVSRLANLLDPRITGRRAFLADGPDGSSGLLILEYVAHSALAEIRHRATAAPGVPATLSLGTEDGASFATQAAARLAAAVDAYPTVLACELLAADRAIRMAATAPDGAEGFGDRSLTAELDAAERWIRGR